MVDQKTIAQRAGVSRATVSRAFTQSANISPKTMAKIQAAMESLGLPPIAWFPNAARKRTMQVLVIAGDISNYFFSRIIKGICDQLSSLGIVCVVCNSNYDTQLEEEQIEFAEANHYLGVILVTAVERPTLSSLLQRVRVPIVFVNRYIRSVEADVVCIDNYMGGYIAASYLLENGHTRIAHVASYKGTTPQEERVQGFAAALEELRPGRHLHNVFYGEGTIERGRQFAQELVRPEMPYTALFVADSQIAIGIVNFIHERGYRVPRDLSILCFDDSPYIDESGLCLSTVRYDPYVMGRVAVNTLMRRLDDASENKYHTMLVPQLIKRRSVKKLL